MSTVNIAKMTTEETVFSSPLLIGITFAILTAVGLVLLGASIIDELRLTLHAVTCSSSSPSSRRPNFVAIRIISSPFV